MTATEDIDTVVRPRRRRLVGWIASAVAVAVCVALCLVYRPWLDPWWPTRHEAAALPTTCPSLLGLPAPQSSSPGPFTVPGDAGVTISGVTCEWGAQDHGFAPLDAKYSLYQRVGDNSGTDEAETASAAQITRYDGPSRGFSLGADTPVAGVGDDARVSNHGDVVVLVARKANVVLTLQYEAPDHEPEDQSQAKMTSSARALLDLVHVA